MSKSGMRVKVAFANNEPRIELILGPWWITMSFEEAKRLQQLLQAELGVPGDLPALAKQERNTAGVTGRARKRGTIAREQEGQ